MKVIVKNDAGMVREIPVGFSWTGFIFLYFTLFARGLFGRAFMLLGLSFFIGLASCTVGSIAMIDAFANNRDAISSVVFSIILFYIVVIFPFSLIIGFKINKWTARYWLDRGYKPVGSGWKIWGPKWGLDSSSLPSEE